MKLCVELFLSGYKLYSHKTRKRKNKRAELFCMTYIFILHFHILSVCLALAWYKLLNLKSARSWTKSLDLHTVNYYIKKCLLFLMLMDRESPPIQLSFLLSEDIYEMDLYFLHIKGGHVQARQLVWIMGRLITYSKY